jgi:lipopolysaccharide transport system ATP-binding protein
MDGAVMSNIAIRAEDLGKLYQIGERVSGYRTLRDTLVEAVASPFQRLRTGRDLKRAEGAPNTLWALRHINFEVNRGDVLGIIGRNGAGKSTLLKLLSRITEPSEGWATIHGRVGSLLEVGTGFHPELTGRENIFLNGAILGMKRAEIERRFDEIVDFAEVAKFIDTPVKRYSSGMYLRLAFSVAAHLEPEILLIDEVLAVGDAEFQRKCLGKMSDVSQQGRTVLFVSHNMSAILNLTEKSIFLDQGQLILHTSSQEAVDQYLASGISQTGERVWGAEEVPITSKPFRPIALRVLDAEQRVADTLHSSEPITIEFDYALEAAISGLRVGVVLMTNRGEYVLTSFDTDKKEQFEQFSVREAGIYRSRCVIPSDILNAGQYSLSVIASTFRIRRYYREDGALTFNVDATGSPGAHWPEPRPGPVRPWLNWQIEELAIGNNIGQR